jgi:hypothetical protein
MVEIIIPGDLPNAVVTPHVGGAAVSHLISLSRLCPAVPAVTAEALGSKRLGESKHTNDTTAPQTASCDLLMAFCAAANRYSARSPGICRLQGLAKPTAGHLPAA